MANYLAFVHPQGSHRPHTLVAVVLSGTSDVLLVASPLVRTKIEQFSNKKSVITLTVNAKSRLCIDDVFHVKLKYTNCEPVRSRF